MKAVRIGEREVGPGHPAYVIAEAGANHDRDLDVAHRLVDVAADAGADAVKFQTYSADTLYSRFTPRISEMDAFGRSPAGETPFELISRIQMPREWLRELRDHARERSIDFLSTPFDLEAVEQLDALEVPAFKIASYDITFRQLLLAVAARGKPVIISTGNSNVGDIERSLEALRVGGDAPAILLHCVSQYPARLDDLNLRAIVTMSSAFDVPVGFSDHTMGNVAAVVATALGACCFEKHFTLDRGRNGPDHPHSAEPDELRDYVSAIHLAEAALGTSRKSVQPSEAENHRLARRSLHARVAIPRGATVTREMLIVKRPALGIAPDQEDLVVGRTARRDIQADEWITWDMV